MITRVVHGWRVAGLIAYLMGPGRAQEHVDPRVIASWDGRDLGWQPVARGSGAGRDLGPLTRAMRAPVVAAGLAESDQQGRRGFVWHCSVRVARGDRVLTDAEWAGVTRELLDGTGVAARDDAGGPRWVAIRHADDHIHIAVVLVRQDTSRRFWPSHDYRRLREVANRVERRLGLAVTASADGTAAPAPGRGEIEKARRAGREPARVELARAVRLAAVAATDVTDFSAELERAGYLVRVRRAPSGDPLGYTVARPGDRDSAGAAVFYSGSRLAPDLSLPRLMLAWASAGSGTGIAHPLITARRQTEQARSVVGAARRDPGRRPVDDIVHATGDVLTAVAMWVPGLRGAAEGFDRASRPPRGSPPRPSRPSTGLRRAARRLVRERRAVAGMGLLDREDPGPAVVALVVALAALVREIAAWQRARDRGHQATAALAAAGHLDDWAAVHARPIPVAASSTPAVVGEQAAGRREGRREPGPRVAAVHQ